MRETRKKNGERQSVQESVISCKVCLQGENKMREAHFNLQSFWSESKPTDHTALTTCPKLQFTFHFLNKCTQYGFRQILFFLHKYFVISSEGKTENVFCLPLLLVSALYPVRHWWCVFVCPIWPTRLLLEGSWDI